VRGGMRGGGAWVCALAWTRYLYIVYDIPYIVFFENSKPTYRRSALVCTLEE